MSHEDYFLSRAISWKKKQNKTESAASSNQDTDDQTATATKPASILDPALRQAIQEITENITKVLDEKLSCLLRSLQEHALQLQNVGKRTDEAEDRISEVEEISTS